MHDTHRANEFGPVRYVYEGATYNAMQEEWMVDGKRHRTFGPAVIWSDNSCTWHLNGYQYDSHETFQDHAGISDEEMAFLLLRYNFYSRGTK